MKTLNLQTEAKFSETLQWKDRSFFKYRIISLNPRYISSSCCLYFFDVKFFDEMFFGVLIEERDSDASLLCNKIKCIAFSFITSYNLCRINLWIYGKHIALSFHKTFLNSIYPETQQCNKYYSKECLSWFHMYFINCFIYTYIYIS